MPHLGFQKPEHTGIRIKLLHGTYLCPNERVLDWSPVVPPLSETQHDIRIRKWVEDHFNSTLRPTLVLRLQVLEVQWQEPGLEVEYLHSLSAVIKR